MNLALNCRFSQCYNTYWYWTSLFTTSGRKKLKILHHSDFDCTNVCSIFLIWLFWEINMENMDINCKIVTILFCLLITQLAVYNRTITRFRPIADDKPRLFISEWDGRYAWLQTTAEHDVVRSMWAGDHGELFFCVYLNREWQFHAKSRARADRCLFGLSSWLSTRSTATRRTRSTAAWLRDPSCRFSSADFRCFQVSNPCWAVHSTVFVHHTALTDQDF